jgi:hypothetical protein
MDLGPHIVYVVPTGLYSILPIAIVLLFPIITFEVRFTEVAVDISLFNTNDNL